MTIDEAISPFLGFWQFFEAIRECGGDEPLNDSDVIMQVSGAGGSCCLHVGDFRALMRAVKYRSDDERLRQAIVDAAVLYQGLPSRAFGLQVAHDTFVAYLEAVEKYVEFLKGEEDGQIENAS